MLIDSMPSTPFLPMKYNQVFLYISCFLAFALCPMRPLAQASETINADSVSKKNQLTLDAQFLSRGELRLGGLPENELDDDFAAFFMERTRLIAGYSRPYLDAKISFQHSGVWGQAGKGSMNLYETWVQLNAKNGMFARLGRQELSYDDERIIGSNDWAMAAASHDVGKFGYEGHGHKAHLILGFNQNAENTNGGTFYANGAQPYKSMQTLWYHYDVPHTKLGASLIFMNLGTQDVTYRVTRFQQLAGLYARYNPNRWLLEGSYYRQFGRSDVNMPIEAWMASGKVRYKITNALRLTTGYDYLSGDEFYYVRGQGQIGLVHRKKQKGFSTLYGSNHQFYGAMDFFYISAFIDGFSPGLQNIYAGVDFSPIKNVNTSAAYHYLATTVNLKGLDRALGHELELLATYSFMGDAKLSAGYSLMVGSNTMKALKRASDNGRLQWIWLSLNITPHLFTTKW